MPKTYLIKWIGLTVWTMKAYLINGELDRKMETQGDAEPWTSGLPLESRATWLVPWLWSWRRLHGRPWVRRARVQGYMVASIATLDVRNGRVSVSGQPPHCNMEGSLFFFSFPSFICFHLVNFRWFSCRKNGVSLGRDNGDRTEERKEWQAARRWRCEWRLPDCFSFVYI